MNNIEIEKAVLGCIITQPLIILDIPKKEELFSDEKNKVIFKKLLEFSENNIEPDIISIEHDLKDKEITLQYLQEIITGDFFIGNIKSYIKSLINFYEYRKFSFLAGKILVDIKNKENINNIKSELLKSLDDDFENIDTHTKNMKEVLKDTIAYIEDRKAGNIGNLKTGYQIIDNTLKKFSEKSLNIIAGRPSMGKTSFALNLFWKMFTEQKKKVALLSFEMTRIEIMNKIFGIESQFNISYDMNEIEYKKISKFSQRYMNEEGFTINDSSTMSIQDIYFWIKKQKLKSGLDVLFIDYLDFIKKPSNDKNINTSEKIGMITKGLKSIAKEEDLYIFLICQLNRDNEKRTFKKPSLSDLKSSGDIEQDADSVIFIHRDDYYEEKRQNPEISSKSEIIIAKNRNGATFSTSLEFNMKHSRFLEIKF